MTFDASRTHTPSPACGGMPRAIGHEPTDRKSVV
jgi:hypothetical protein